jgi:hypothetical protein
MGQRQRGKSFLGRGLWVPLEVAAPLSRSLQLLRGRLDSRRPVGPAVALLIHLKVLKLERLLLAGSRHHQLVPAGQWQSAVRDVQALSDWLATAR